MKISIITVAFNSNATIADTLQSVATQTYSNIEHIIVDGASKDNTLEIVNQFPHVAKIISEPDKGIYDAMNKGVKMATGDVIGILNSDDIFADDDVITDVINCFIKKEIDLLYGNISYFKTEEPNKITRYWKSQPYYDNFFENGDVPPHPSLFVSRKIYDTISHYKIDFRIGADYEFMFRALKVYQYKSFYFDRTIVKMREGGVSTQGLNSYITSWKEVMSVWRMNGVEIPVKLYWKRPLKKVKQLLTF